MTRIHPLCRGADREAPGLGLGRKREQDAWGPGDAHVGRAGPGSGRKEHSLSAGLLCLPSVVSAARVHFTKERSGPLMSRQKLQVGLLSSFWLKNNGLGTSLVAQWLRC